MVAGLGRIPWRVLRYPLHKTNTIFVALANFTSENCFALKIKLVMRKYTTTCVVHAAVITNELEVPKGCPSHN